MWEIWLGKLSSHMCREKGKERASFKVTKLVTKHANKYF